jgi:Spy/CpxP family protein refolding chaperone
MQVDASIDESDVGRIRAGQKASFTVDAYPGQTFEGEVNQVRKAAQNIANVVTYIAVVRFSNTGNRLLPGMTANVRLITDQRESVLKVPNAALRVRIAGVEPAATGPAGAASGAVKPAKPDSGTTTGGWRWMSEANAQPAGGGGGMAAMRERLVTELKLSPEQAAKLDAISADMRPQFMAMRDVAEDQRPAAREKLLADMRGRISAMLDAGLRAQYAQMQAQGPASGQRPGGPPPGAAGAPATPPVATKKGATDAGYATPALPNAPVTAAASKAKAVAAPTGPQAPAITGQGPLVETRNRLVSELRMDVAQAEKLDAIYAAARPRFMALREVPAEERGKARERISGDMRAQISTILTPEQQQRYAAITAESAGRQATRGRIYLLGADGKPRAYNVRLGISDGTSTELMVGPNSPEGSALTEGAVVIIGTSGAGSTAKPSGGGPRLPF